MRIPHRYAGFVLAVLLSVTMGAIMSFLATSAALGWSQGFWAAWIRAYGAMLVAGTPVGLLVTPVLKAFVDRHTIP